MRQTRRAVVSRIVLWSTALIGAATLLFGGGSPDLIRFENVAPSSGIHFTLQNHPTPEKRSIEAMPGGVAVFDYNNDGLPDIFFANGAAVPSLVKTFPGDANRLYRNDGRLHFTDVTEAAGLSGAGFANGAAAADFDNDGFTDLFVPGVNRSQLFRNRGDGTFEDVTAKSGIVNKAWAVAAAWLDFDGDGRLDLFIVNYLDWNPAQDTYCGDTGRQLRIYCHPNTFNGTANKLYRNRGDGTFEDVSESTGINRLIGKGMSAGVADYDNDGYPDIFITNDNTRNFLLHNIKGKRFEEVGLTAGVALLDSGRAVSSMGVDWRDYDNDGKPDLAIAALAHETFPLFHNDGGGMFSDATYTSGLARLTLPHSGWCSVLADFDNDGGKDLFVSGGHVNDRIETTDPPTRYSEPNLLLRNEGRGRFTQAAEPSFAVKAAAHRGCAVADFDGDGKLDIVVTALNAEAELWHNTTDTAGRHFIDVDLEGVKSNRSALGAQLHVGGQYQMRTSAQGYASSSLAPVHFGDVPAPTRLNVQWPDGHRQELAVRTLDKIIHVKETP